MGKWTCGAVLRKDRGESVAAVALSLEGLVSILETETRAKLKIGRSAACDKSRRGFSGDLIQTCFSL